MINLPADMEMLADVKIGQTNVSVADLVSIAAGHRTLVPDSKEAEAIVALAQENLDG